MGFITGNKDEREDLRLLPTVNSFEGSGTGSGRFDPVLEAAEKRKNVSLLVWASLWITVMLSVLIYFFVSDLILFNKGDVAIGEYRTGSWKVKYTAPDGKNYYADSAFVGGGDKTVEIYYMGTDYKHARVKTYGFYLISIPIGMALLAFFIIMTIKTAKPPKHSRVKNE